MEFSLFISWFYKGFQVIYNKNVSFKWKRRGGGGGKEEKAEENNDGEFCPKKSKWREDSKLKANWNTCLHPNEGT